jgi:two-component system response regulator PilR (NtrC family)
MVREGAFREDLYYRIHVIQIPMPPLRERTEDIPAFVEFFSRRHGQRMGRKITGAEPEFLTALARYRWPGNIRELENVVERAVALSTGSTLLAETLPPEVHGAAVRPAASLRLDQPVDIELHIEAERRRYMEAALEASGGVQTRAAERLGMTFRSFRYFAKKFRLTGRDGTGDAGDDVLESVSAVTDRGE